MAAAEPGDRDERLETRRAAIRAALGGDGSPESRIEAMKRLVGRHEEEDRAEAALPPEPPPSAAPLDPRALRLAGLRRRYGADPSGGVR